ncbi:hypothetical protein F4679DRAFT_274777 [Xylaria curta]|nr:hypothetical protein F4679DRAFT_274777 [Xylaria curta]
MRSKSSVSRGSLVSTPDSGHDGDDEWNTGPKSQGGRRPREIHGHSIASYREDTTVSNLRRSESVESSRRSRHRSHSGSRGSQPHIRPRTYQSYHSEQGSDQEFRGRDKYRRSSQDFQQDQSPPLLYRSQSRSSHSSRHTDARQGQQRRENVTNIDIHPSTKRYYSTSSKDSGYGSHDPERDPSSSSIASTRQRSSSRPHPRHQSRFDGGDRSRPPIALDRAERGIRRAEARTRSTMRGSRKLF